MEFSLRLCACVVNHPDGFGWNRGNGGSEARGRLLYTRIRMLFFWVYAPLILAAGLWNRAIGAGTWVALFGSGLALWTLLEYAIHRFAFHRFAPHYLHHEHPADRQYIFAPLWFSLGSAGVLWPLLSLAAGSWQHGALAEAGAVCGYLLYEAVHVRIHSAAGGRLLRALRRHHYYHHFADERLCYGVTSPFWDMVFGSLPVKELAADERR